MQASVKWMRVGGLHEHENINFLSFIMPNNSLSVPGGSLMVIHHEWMTSTWTDNTGLLCERVGWKHDVLNISVWLGCLYSSRGPSKFLVGRIMVE